MARAAGGRRFIVATLAVLLVALSVLGLFAALGVTGTARWLNIALLLVEATIGLFAVALIASIAAVPSSHKVPVPGATAVSILVPVYREAPEVLAATLAGIASLPRPADVWVLDDTPTADGGADIERVAKAAGVRYVHRDEPRGSKAGALNDVLPLVASEYIVILDVDHIPAPDLLDRLLERFVDARTGFVQGKVHWRNETSAFRRLAGTLQHQFHEVVQPGKDARDAVVFLGSGAMFRKAALVDVGGFPEETLVEDFDITLRMAARGWKGRAANAVVATGVLPWSAADQARQLWRWSAGTTRVLALRIGEVTRSDSAPASARMELLVDAGAYLAGGLVPFVGILLLSSAVLRIPILAPVAALAVVVPLILLGAHATGAAVGLRRAGKKPTLGLVVGYHLVSLAFTPVLFLSSVWGLMGGVGTHGRVAKVPTKIRVGYGEFLATGVTGLFGVGLIAASVSLVSIGSSAALWAAELGVAFLLPLPLMVGPALSRAEAAPEFM
ncbi:MAG: glycosyltransferase [Thermoplasmatota archaeon]